MIILAPPRLGKSYKSSANNVRQHLYNNPDPEFIDASSRNLYLLVHQMVLKKKQLKLLCERSTLNNRLCFSSKRAKSYEPNRGK